MFGCYVGFYKVEEAFSCKVFVSFFSTAKSHHNFELMTCLEEFISLLCAGFKVVFLGANANLNALTRTCITFLLAKRFFRFLFLLVAELVVAYYFGNGGNGFFCNKDKIKAFLFGELEGIGSCHNAKCLIFVVKNTNLRSFYFVVDVCARHSDLLGSRIFSSSQGS